MGKFLFSLLFPFLFIISSCSQSLNISDTFSLPDDNISTEYVKTIAVLPFKNNTLEENLDKYVRVSFYSHLCAREFKDIELKTVDRKIKNINFTHLKGNENIVKKLGKILNCDYIVEGNVDGNDKVFVGIYSLNSIKITINIYDTNSGTIVWTDTVKAESHKGSIPTSIFSFPFISLSTGSNLDLNTTFVIIETACRTLAYRIPSELIAKNFPVYNEKYFIQVGAFLSNNIAVYMIKRLKKCGFSPFIKKIDKWYKVFIGPFSKERVKLEIKKVRLFSKDATIKKAQNKQRLF